MVDAPVPSQWPRLRAAMTRALRPVAIAAPLLPLVCAVIARPPGSSTAGDVFLGGLVGLEAVVLIAALLAVVLVRMHRERTLSPLLGRGQAWAALVLGLGTVWFSAGVAGYSPTGGGLIGQALLDGLLLVAGGLSGLIALTVQALRRDRRQEKRAAAGGDT